MAAQSTPDTLEKRHPKPAFQASEKLAKALEQISIDMIDLHLVGKQAHWNVVGHNFRDMHLQLDELVLAARGFADTIAERMRALYVTVDGRASRVAGSSSITEFPTGEVDTAKTADLITKAIYACCDTMRSLHDDIDDEDPTTADILHEFLGRLEQLAWMIDAENRIPQVSEPGPIEVDG